MRLTIGVKSGRFKFLWLKYVSGFKASEHCAKCLVGPYDKAFPFRQDIVGRTIETDLSGLDSADLGYLCGVTRKWAWNLHVAFRPGDGEIGLISEDVTLLIEGVSQVPIVRPSDMPDLPPEFATCRNYWLGWSLYPGSREGHPRPVAQQRLNLS